MSNLLVSAYVDSDSTGEGSLLVAKSSRFVDAAKEPYRIITFRV